MDSLELEIPPPIVAIVSALAMWIICLFTPTIAVDALARILVAGTIAAVGLGSAVAGAMAFRRAETTLDPMKPERASSLVTRGIYRVTRNPMYVGLLFLQLAWAIFLAAPWALIMPLAFVIYIKRFQIMPEERALASLFGAAYADYKARVRRWL
jgi:protein-S-isoprenylcysteine O-methyltransferase Ste14